MAFGSGSDEHDAEMSEINMIPLVDIMLVLLIIFIITVPVVTHTVRLDLPRAQNERLLVEPETVTIAITADGAVHWNQTRVDERELFCASNGRPPRSPNPNCTSAATGAWPTKT
jgi:biopolymer transport protein ExbD